MRIDEIHIYGFGKFRDYKLNFADNFNLIYGENENGKTTIAEFIKMMFYGNRPRNNDAFTNPRIKYRPLDGGTMAGSITFLHQGTRYRIEREFKGSNATDKITLYNLDLGESTALSGKDEIGEKFFSLNFGAFEKSVFINNSVTFLNDAEADGAINARLSNMNTTGDEDISYEAVVKRINAAMEEIKTKTGRGGALVKLDAALSALNEDAANQKILAERQDELQERIQKAEQVCASLSDKKSKCFEELKTAEKFEIKTKLEEFVRVAEQYEKIERQITLTGGGVADKSFCDKLEALIDKCQKYAENCEFLNSEIAHLTDDVAALEQSALKGENVETLKQELAVINSRAEALQREKDGFELQKIRLSEKIGLAKPKTNIALVIIGCVLAVISAIGGVMFSPYIFSGGVVGVLLFILGFILKIRPDTKQLQSELTVLERQIENIQNDIAAAKQSLQTVTLKINELTVKNETGKSLLQDKKGQVIAKRTELLEMQNNSATALNEMLTFAASIKRVSDIEGAKALLDEIEQNIDELARLQVAAEYAAKGTNCKNLSEAKQRLSVISLNQNAPTGTLDKLREELKQITDEHAGVSRELAALKAEAKAAFSGLRVPAEIEREKRELQTQIAEQKEYYEDLSLALDGLTAAFGEIRRSFSGVLENRALELLSGITNGKYNSINVSKNFDITVSESDSFGSHGLEYLSKGAMHQAYFSLRLALSELMGKEAGGLPVILDDAFSQYDDVRLLKALEFLYNYSINEQVIFFTCHNDCKAAAQNIGAKIINL